MADVPVNITDRAVEHPTRYQLTDVKTGEVFGTFDFTRVPGDIASPGSVIGKKLLEDIQRGVTAYADAVGESSVQQSTSIGAAQISDLRGEVQTHTSNTLIHPRIAYGRHWRAMGGETEVAVSLGFRPKIVFVSNENSESGQSGSGKFGYYADGYALNMALAIDGYPGYGILAEPDRLAVTSSITITDDGFTISAGINRPGLANVEGSYFAFG